MTSHKDPLWYLKTSRVLFYEPVKQIFPPGQWTDTAAWERESILYPGHCAADVGLTRSVCSCCAAHCDLGFNQRLVCQGVTLTSFLCCWAWLTSHSSLLTSDIGLFSETFSHILNPTGSVSQAGIHWTGFGFSDFSNAGQHGSEGEKS